MEKKGKKVWTEADKSRFRAMEKERRERALREHKAWVEAGCPDVPMEAMVRWVMSAMDVPQAGSCPCPQARTLLGWARRNRELFFRLYVLKLVGGSRPAEKGGSAEEASEYLANLERQFGKGGG